MSREYTEVDYRRDLLEIETLMDATSEKDVRRLELLADRVYDYEEIYYPIDLPTEAYDDSP